MDNPVPIRRLFFALWPAAAERAAIAAWQPALQTLCGGRAMRPQTLHCTLAFLGAVPEGRLEALHCLAREVACPPFSLHWAAARYWGHNHIVYGAPLDPPPALLVLVQTLQARLRAHHFAVEQQSYQAHVTLLRNAHWSDAPLPALPAVTWQVRDFALVQSLSDAAGARYEVLQRYAGGGLE
ncbi:MAG: RNA 2',3'-cyclic phosphodiesterase [Pseudomonadota bacterium]